MKINIIKHNTEIIVGDYQFADKVKEQVLSLLKVSRPISKDSTNVKAWHSHYNTHETINILTISKQVRLWISIIVKYKLSLLFFPIFEDQYHLKCKMA